MFNNVRDLVDYVMAKKPEHVRHYTVREQTDVKTGSKYLYVYPGTYHDVLDDVDSIMKYGLLVIKDGDLLKNEL